MFPELVLRKVLSAVKGKGVIISLILGVALILLIVKFHDWRESKKGEEKHAELENARRQAQTPLYSAPVVIKTGKEKTSYTFGEDGCVMAPLYGDWTDYPVGGEIEFINRSGQVVLKHRPAVKSTSSLPGGDYRICKVGESATGVDIW